MLQRIKVLHLIKELGVGGAERLVALLVQAGNHAQFEYAVAYVMEGQDALASAIQGAGFQVYGLGGRHHGDLRWALQLRRLMLEQHFDVVHLHLPYTAGLGRIVAWSLGPRRRPKVIQTQHDVWDRTRWATRWLSRVTWWMDDADLLVSHAVRDSLPESLARRSEVLLHGIDLTAVASSQPRDAIRREMGVTTGDIVVLTVANMRPQKGYEVLLEAALAVRAQGLPVRFVAVGHGPLLAEVAAMRDRMGLGETFALLGPRSDVFDLMSAADMFVLASHHEGFPLAVMEALASGLPVVVTAVGELPLVVRAGVEGILVPPGDSAALADAILRLASDETERQRMREAARRGGSRFDITTASRRIEEVYATLVEHGE